MSFAPTMKFFEDRPQTVEADTQPVLLVFLQGAYMQAEDFLAYGFVAALRARGITADVILADNDPAYSMAGTVVERLHEDVIAQLLPRAYQEIWLVGISLGAFSALAYASQHSDLLTGICLISPYPGTQEVLRPIRQAGGLRPWAALPLHAEEDDEHRVWRWLAAWRDASTKQPALWLGTGESDRFIDGQRMLADLLPPAQVHYLSGAHDWPVWQAYWRIFLDKGPLQHLKPAVLAKQV